MSRFRTEIIIAVASAIAGALVGGFVAWSIGATVRLPGWLVGLMAGVAIAASAVAVAVWLRIVDMKSLTFDPEIGVYYSASPRATNPGPFCPKCYEVDGYLVTIHEEGQGSHFCQVCCKRFYRRPKAQSPTAGCSSGV